MSQFLFAFLSSLTRSHLLTHSHSTQHLHTDATL